MNFDRSALQHSWYYIRLGLRYKRRDPDGGFEASDVLDDTVPFWNSVRVSTYSLFIDPLYPGPGATAPLEFGLVNLNDSRSSMPAASPLAKVSFFDVSDSGLMELLPGSESEQKFARRSGYPGIKAPTPQ